MQTPVITLFAKSPDGIRIAYDRCGAGPAVVLLHGGGSRRQAWHEAGYVKRLQENFTVITIDLRGHGESGLPTEPADYTMEKMMQDVIAVAEESNVDSFIIWGFSFGGRVARYLAAHSGKVARVILMGTPLGSGISSEFRQYIEDFCTHWPPIIQAQHDGVLDPASFSPRRSGDFISLQRSGDDGLGTGNARLARRRTSRYSLPHVVAGRFRRPGCDGQRQGIRAFTEKLQGSTSYR